MELVIQWICENADNAHYLLFGLLMLAGFNVPVSEDFVLIIGGMLASTVVPENTYSLFIWIFLGAYLSDWTAYWIGRTLGPRIWTTHWLRGVATPKRMKRVQDFYARYGVSTLLIGRFIPFGVRNCLFMAAGMGRMPFLRFLIADGLACIVSNLLLFTLAYKFGENYLDLYDWVMTVNRTLFIVFLSGLGILAIFWHLRRRREPATS